MSYGEIRPNVIYLFLHENMIAVKIKLQWHNYHHWAKWKRKETEAPGISSMRAYGKMGVVRTEIDTKKNSVFVHTIIKLPNIRAMSVGRHQPGTNHTLNFGALKNRPQPYVAEETISHTIRIHYFVNTFRILCIIMRKPQLYSCRCPMSMSCARRPIHWKLLF